MSGEPKRYFVNPYSDIGDGAPPPLSSDILDHYINIYSNNVLKGFTKDSKNADGGLYVGLAGGAYMLLHLSQLPGIDEQKKKLYLQEAVKFLDVPLRSITRSKGRQHITDVTGFLTGNIGVYAVAAVIYHKLGLTDDCNNCLSQMVEAANILQQPDWFKNGGDELFVGRAGFLCAILWLRRQLNAQIYPEASCHAMLSTMLQSGVQYSKRKSSRLPLMYHYYGTQYLGPAHGLGGILLVLLSFPDWLQANPASVALIKQTIDGIASLQTANGNFPCAMDEISGGRPAEDELVHWCHGAPGMIYLFAKAFTVFQDPHYLEICKRCGDVTWQKGLLKKGPGICHGVAGSGYVFLILHKLTGDKKYLHRAQNFSHFMFSDTFQRARTPDSPYSLYEGIAGTICYLSGVRHPQAAAFPFFDMI